MISGLHCDRVIETATMVFDGPTNSAMFLWYVEPCQMPSLRAGRGGLGLPQRAQNTAGVEEANDAAGASVLRPTTYSPDLNTIEKLWSKIKS